MTRRSSKAPRVGLFGILGSGNLGNDAAFEVVLTYLRRDHPEAVIDAMCMGTQRMKDHYDIDATPMLWYQQFDGRVQGLPGTGLKVLGKVIDAARTFSWVRRHDAVIVPGAGVLEATLPLKASGVPYTMFLLSSSGKIVGSKVALVSVGANRMNQRLTRTLFHFAARFAFYRSYRDEASREAMGQGGLDVSTDPVYPDLVLGLPVPPHGPGDPHTVGVGVMAYYGGNDDRARAEELYASYVESMKQFVAWLIDNGHRVRLFWGDNKASIDDLAVRAIQEGLLEERPDIDPSFLLAEPFATPADLLEGLTSVGTFVGARYHNVASALRVSRPTISIGYSAKHQAMMTDMGLAEFCQSASSLDLDLLKQQFTELERRMLELRQTLLERNEAINQDLEHQFKLLSSLLFSSDEPSLALSEVG